MAHLYFLFSEAAQCGYIGSTQELNKRLDRHFRELAKGIHHNLGLQRVWDKFGDVELRDTQEFETLDEARSLEERMIEILQPWKGLLNIGKHAIGGDNLTNNPNRDQIVKDRTESIQKRVNSLSKEERKAIWGRSGENNPMYGRTHSVEARRAMSAANLGQSRTLGFKASLETRAKLSKIASQRTGEKNPFYGKKHSQETLNKIREKKIGKPNLLQSQPLEIDGAIYRSYAEATKATGIPLVTIRHRCLSNNKRFVGYRVLPKCPTTIESIQRNETGDE